MKKIVTLLCALAVLGTGLWAQETLLEADVASLKVSVYGDANARFGMQSMTADNTHPWSVVLMSGLSGNSAALGTLLNPTNADLLAAQTAFAGAFIPQLLGANGDLSATTGAEADIARRAGFTQATATAIANAYMTSLTVTAPGDQAAAAAAAGAAYNTWAGAGGGMALLLTDVTLNGHYDLPSFTKSGMYYGLKNENAVRLGTKIASADGKLTAEVAAKFTSSKNDATPVDVKTAWIQYDLGPVAIKYNSHDGNQRWDADVLYVGDASLENALDFQIKPVPGIGYAFFTLMSDEGITSGVKYANKDFRTVPMMQLGYVYDADLGAMGEVEATLGGALDMYAKKDADYLGYIAFGGATWSKGNMAVETGSLVLGLNGLYGQNTATLAGMNGSDMEQATLGMTNLIAMLTAGEKGIARSVSKVGEKDSTVYGGRFFGGATLWTGGIVSLDARVSQLTFAGDSDPFTAIRFTGGLTQFLSENFSATLGGGYEQYSVQAGNKDYKAASGYEITLDIGYRF